MSTLILTSTDVADLVTEAEAVDAVERAFALHGTGSTCMPPKVYLPLPEFDGDFRAMPVFVGDLDVGYGRQPSAGVKWINAHPRNPERYSKPSVVGVFILSDPRDAHPLAVMDATKLTALRTGAAAAVATKHLARSGAETLGIIGCGAQSHSVVTCHAALRNWKRIFLFDVDATHACALAANLAERGLMAQPTDANEATAADVVCTLTPSRDSIVRRNQLRDGAHVNALGADAPGKRELGVEILRDARIFLDDIRQATESGEVNVPLREGTLERRHIAGTLGEVVAGRIRGRTNDADITLFDSTGLAVQDVALARLVYERARRAGAGVELALVDS
jgi:alanine dehydrogenase